ncbi:MAG: membrane protein insertion efficiency factor YidD [Clostridiales bacterium]|nr:MAG: membrane protein insertion efficiency factor YidD [Clostridiales bacterium]
MKRVAIALIKFYQKNVSSAKRPCCRFYPTCSSYALEAFEKHSFFKALGFSLWRILRCNPFCKGGYDPVPPVKKNRRK